MKIELIHYPSIFPLYSIFVSQIDQEQWKVNWCTAEYCSLWCDFLQPEEEGTLSLLYMWAWGQVDLQQHVSCLLKAMLTLLSSVCRSMQLCCVGLSWWQFPVLAVVLRCSVQAQHQRCRPLTSLGEIQWLLYLTLSLSLSPPAFYALSFTSLFLVRPRSLTLSLNRTIIFGRAAIVNRDSVRDWEFRLGSLLWEL